MSKIVLRFANRHLVLVNLVFVDFLWITSKDQQKLFIAVTNKRLNIIYCLFTYLAAQWRQQVLIHSQILLKKPG